MNYKLELKAAEKAAQLFVDKVDEIIEQIREQDPGVDSELGALIILSYPSMYLERPLIRKVAVVHRGEQTHTVWAKLEDGRFTIGSLGLPQEIDD